MTERGRMIPGIQKLIKVEAGVRHQRDLKLGRIQPNPREAEHLWRARKRGRPAYLPPKPLEIGEELMYDTYS